MRQMGDVLFSLPELIFSLVCATVPATCKIILFRRIPIKMTDFHDEVVAYLGSISFKIRLKYFYFTPTMHTSSSSHGDKIRYLIMQTEVIKVVMENHRLQSNQKIISSINCDIKRSIHSIQINMHQHAISRNLNS